MQNPWMWAQLVGLTDAIDYEAPAAMQDVVEIIFRYHQRFGNPEQLNEDDIDAYSEEELNILYRLAWAEQAGVPVEQVTASFCYVRSGRIETPSGLPGRKELSDLLIGNR